MLGCIGGGAACWRSRSAAVELRRRHPLLDVRLFRVPAFATGAAAITVFFMAMFGFFFLVMQYIQLVLGYSAAQARRWRSPRHGTVR